jgi:hypothetical protein
LNVPVNFEVIVDPTLQILASRDELGAIVGSAGTWRTQSSGIRLKPEVAIALEKLVVGRVPKPMTTLASNPDWAWDELILALGLYLQHRSALPGKNSPIILGLSDTLIRLGEKLYSPEDPGRICFGTPGRIHFSRSFYSRIESERHPLAPKQRAELTCPHS